jgi:hypothetical protein
MNQPLIRSSSERLVSVSSHHLVLVTWKTLAAGRQFGHALTFEEIEITV